MKQLDFREGSITKSIVAGAVPMLIAQLVNLLYNLIDRVYIGRIPDVGSEALGGLGLTFPVIIMITAFTNLYAGGGAPLFSIAMGGKKKVRAEAIMQQCLYLEAATAVVLMIIGISCAESLLKLFGAGDTAMLYSLPYLRIYLLGTVFSMISIGMNPFINAQGFPMLGMISVVTGAVLNLGLDPLFIFLFDMGISGAALATIISQAVSAVIVFSILINKKMPLPLKLSFFSIKHPRVRLSLQIVTLGVASFVMQFTNALVNIVCNAVLSRTGGHLYISVMEPVVIHADRPPASVGS